MPGGDLLAKAAERSPAIGIASATAGQRGGAEGRQGVSPLHRMSFQSLAYQQLAL